MAAWTIGGGRAYGGRVSALLDSPHGNVPSFPREYYTGEHFFNTNKNVITSWYLILSH